MSSILAKINAEPVLVIAVIQAVLTLLVTFGLRLTPDQTGAILTLSGAILAIVARGQVTPA